jgi:hypothetical protein
MSRGRSGGRHKKAGRKWASLQVEKAGIEGQRKVAEADLGPVCYLATLVGRRTETALRWFVLVVCAGWTRPRSCCC